MGIGDRHYNRPDEPTYRPARPGGSGGGFGSYIRMQFEGAKVTRNLIILNTVIYVVELILFRWQDRIDLFVQWGCFHVGATLEHLHLWRPLTYQFLHATPSHLLFNMLGLFFFGPIVERWLGSRRYLAFYLLCGFGGAVVFTVTVLAGWLGDGPMVGASGCILGVLAACAVLAPHARVLVYGIIPTSMRVLALIYMAMIGYNLLVRGNNAGGDAAHLGGAVAGFVLIKLPWLLAWARHIPIGSASGQLASPRSSNKPAGEGFFANRAKNAAQKAARSKREAAERDEAEVNRILDKVKAEGMYTLTDKEKATLQRATDRQRGQG